MKHLITASALALFATGAYAQDTKVIGVSIPAATHGWAGGMNYWAQAAVDRLEATYPHLDFVLHTAGDPAEQVADIEDMMATRKLYALLCCRLNPAADGRSKAVRDAGAWVTVFDRGLSERGSTNFCLFAGDNPGFGAVAGKSARQDANGGKIVILRGIPTTIDNERVDNFMAAIEGTGSKSLLPTWHWTV